MFHTEVHFTDGPVITLNPKQGERAVLIKNNGGDWGIVTGRWNGYKQGVPPVGGLRGEHGSSGSLCIRFYKLPCKTYPQTLTLGYTRKIYGFDLASSQIDLYEGKITIGEGCHEVAENIALAFSVSLLHVLCVPRPKGWKEGLPVKPPPIMRGSLVVEGVPSDDMALIMAAGLLISTPSNFYFENLYGKGKCALCGGGVVEFNYNDPGLASSKYGYGDNGVGCGGACGTVCSGGCGGCSGACGGVCAGCGGGGCGGGGCGGCGGCGGGCGGCG